MWLFFLQDVPVPVGKKKKSRKPTGMEEEVKKYNRSLTMVVSENVNSVFTRQKNNLSVIVVSADGTIPSCSTQLKKGFDSILCYLSRVNAFHCTFHLCLRTF